MKNYKEEINQLKRIIINDILKELNVGNCYTFMFESKDIPNSKKFISIKITQIEFNILFDSVIKYDYISSNNNGIKIETIYKNEPDFLNMLVDFIIDSISYRTYRTQQI